MVGGREWWWVGEGAGGWARVVVDEGTGGWVRVWWWVVESAGEWARVLVGAKG